MASANGNAYVAADCFKYATTMHLQVVVTIHSWCGMHPVSYAMHRREDERTNQTAMEMIYTPKAENLMGI